MNSIRTDKNTPNENSRKKYIFTIGTANYFSAVFEES